MTSPFPDAFSGLAKRHFLADYPGGWPAVRLKQTVFKTPFLGVPFDFGGFPEMDPEGQTYRAGSMPRAAAIQFPTIIKEEG